MSQEKNPNIEELLNSFIDGELTERERTEVQRLISHDAQVAQRLRELQKTQMLVGSLPRAEAPAQIMNGIKASLERDKVSDEPVWSAERFEKRVGARHLLARKVLAAAAMIGLVAIFGGVIYTIVAPDADYRAVPTMAFNGRLELKTKALMEVDAFINRAIEDNELSDCVSLKSRGNRRVYSITCSREDLNLLLADLANIWERFDSSTLFVEAKPPADQVVVNGVSAEQIAKLITIPKPDLTSGVVEPNEKPTRQQVPQKQVHLSIVVAGSE